VAPVSEKVEPSSSGDDDDSSDGNPDFSSDNGDSSEAEQGRSRRAALAGIQEGEQVLGVDLSNTHALEQQERMSVADLTKIKIGKLDCNLSIT
jgi:hypothetical protein